jgi:hypothetical protein
MTDIGALLEPEMPPLRRYARAAMGDASRADDLVEDWLCLAHRIFSGPAPICAYGCSPSCAISSPATVVRQRRDADDGDRRRREGGFEP